MVYYNEYDPFAAAWLRELIAAGHIAFGVVDERSIEDVLPDELRQFKQCHFFAGIGVWSYALRRAGWPDDRQVWTGSCPCQPFSAAGKGDGFADERHLWPAFHHLIEQCTPDVVFGEQVASKDGLAWIDLVLADLEGTGYSAGAVDTCAAGFGAPHIRQRLYWCGERLEYAEHEHERSARQLAAWPRHTARAGETGGMGDDDDARSQGYGRLGQLDAAEGRQDAPRHCAEAGAFSGLEHCACDGREQRRAEPSGRCASGGCCAGGMADAEGCGRTGQLLRTGSGMQTDRIAQDRGADRPRPTNGHWRDADWLFCRDGKWRPVEPGTFPLAHGAAARVGRLRGYGNAINAQQAQAFIETYMSATR